MFGRLDDNESIYKYGLKFLTNPIVLDEKPVFRFIYRVVDIAALPQDHHYHRGWEKLLTNDLNYYYHYLCQRGQVGRGNNPTGGNFSSWKISPGVGSRKKRLTLGPKLGAGGRRRITEVVWIQW